ncbi:peptidoglycan/xylan/chitin deacetylase (PgdA/CDA1 family) [Kineothrix alysoides]|uniref:Peptidoglycan/xylan/chitin deacetylase (PgdA/CDA1 family) n=1 Tax=Kineothrix alysoides TaxID=1469948 RepID=A0A4R1QXT0_9FIRM|nr:polysaccharide deacetylase family protein [Kineothrix alysoides]TCL56250.1 peptidoglycan/xylan/chitin deacetylase (PgdA/CDA1 family) [Kineothrix alysoides]
MSFTALVYHEIREGTMFSPEQTHPIEVRQDYEDNLPSPLFITLENFVMQMEYLYENGYHTLTLEEVRNYYYDKATLPDKSVLLTFDDCYQSIARYAYPLLKKYGFHGVVFVVTGWLNSEKISFMPEKSVCLTQHELEEMAGVFEYANHTDLFHTRSSAAVGRMMEADDLEFSEDLDRCNAQSIVNAKDTFAYPFSLFEDRNVSLLKSKGFLLAFTTNNGPNTQETDPLLLNRMVVPYFMDLAAFKEILG